MGLETGTYISDLNSSNPASSDPKSQGDDHLRLIKSCVKATFPNVSGAVTPTHTELNYVDGVTSAIQDQLDALASAGAAKNKIINGNMAIWQRGVSFVSPSSTDYLADRFQFRKSGLMQFTVSPSAILPTVAQAGQLFPNSMLMDVTSSDVSIGSTDYCALVQHIEGYNYRSIAQAPFTLSFWVRSPKTGTHCVAFSNSGNDRTYVAEYTVSAANTWEKKEINVTASPSAGTWNYGNGTGLSVRFTLACGSSYQTTAGSWQTGNYYGTSSQVNVCDSTANNFYITGIQVEAGSNASAFENLSFQDQYILCQRYYSQYFMSYRAYAGTTTFYYIPFSYKVDMRTNPTVTQIAAGTWTNIASIGSYGGNTDFLRWEMTVSGGGVFGILNHGVEVDAEL